MLRRRNLPVVLVVALMGAATWHFRNVLFPDGPPSPPAPFNARATAPHSPAAGEPEDAAAPDPFAVALAARISPGDRNPFLTAAEQRGGNKFQHRSSETDTGGPSHRLRGIVVEDGRRSAFLDGRIVGEGDKVNGLQVLRIRPGEVLVTDGARRWTLPLSPIEPEAPETFDREWK